MPRIPASPRRRLAAHPARAARLVLVACVAGAGLGAGAARVWAQAAAAPNLAPVPPLELQHGNALDQTLTAVGLVGAAFALDHAVGAGYPERGPGLAFEEPGETFGGATLLVAGTAALAAGGIVFHQPVLVRTAKESALALGVTTAAVSLVKLVSQRERPDGSNRYSFPSGHTAGAFAVATVLDHEFGRRFGRFAYFAAATAGYARLADNKHYFSDVVAGMLVGHLVGRLVTRHHHVAVPAPPAELPEPPTP